MKWHRRFAQFALAGLIVATLAPAPAAAVAAGSWGYTGDMGASQARYRGLAVTLPTGKVLVSGGGNSTNNLASALLYDPALGTWAATGSMNSSRIVHTATLLQNGTVLAAGGVDDDYDMQASAELYSPAAGTWAPTGSLNQARYYHAAALLDDGRVLVAGGINESMAYIGSAEVYSPTTGGWTTTSSMAVTRSGLTLTLSAERQGPGRRRLRCPGRLPRIRRDLGPGDRSVEPRPAA